MASTPTPAATALGHLRVLDLSRILAGPWASQMLADLGADVVKVERPGDGDDTRHWGPPYLPNPQGQPSNTAAYFACANRNKRSIVIDFSNAEDLAKVKALVAQADVVIENYKVGGLATHGLDAKTLCAAHPRLIYCSITGFGQTGPDAGRAGYDFLIQGMGGLMSLTGHPEGSPGAGPMKAGVALVDVMTGLYASNAILAALAWRERSGLGQYIDLGLLDVQVATLANQAMNHLVSGQAPKRLGNAHPNIVPYQDFPTADGHMILAVGNDGQFARLCQVLKQPNLALDPRFASNASRVKHRETLIPLLNALTASKTTAHWMAELELAQVPCGPINTLDAVFTDRQVLARGLQRSFAPGSSYGAVPTVSHPAQFSATPAVYRRPPPGLGEHQEEVLSEWLGSQADG